MRKLVLVLLGALVAFPLGALTHDAVADRRVIHRRLVVPGPGAGPGPMMFAGFVDAEYVHLAKADDALHEALAEINASQREDEGIWADRTGRAKDARDAIENTTKKLDRLIDWATPTAQDEFGR